MEDCDAYRSTFPNPDSDVDAQEDINSTYNVVHTNNTYLAAHLSSCCNCAPRLERTSYCRSYHLPHTARSGTSHRSVDGGPVGVSAAPFEEHRQATRNACAQRVSHWDQPADGHGPHNFEKQCLCAN
ncbi:hypothetical protein HPB50_010315 [Hyalomma asiaticum]|uniref:Uncharacterized protein n=1 Tax=Hyalomma asiaticum TaxID=266040 RepID=A0ACB7TGC2_HYAAI|nr:hypothetical protein HPB50_010315 [Hyalomma asiaticum]